MTRRTDRAVRTLILAGGLAALAAPVAAQQPARPSAAAPAPDDPYYPQQRSLFEKLHVLEAWALTKGRGVRVGVVDSGFDFFHPDLKGRLAPGTYAPGGFHGEFFENLAHGTLVASIIAARADNAEGMAGLAPGCQAIGSSYGMIEHEALQLMRRVQAEHPGDPAAVKAAMKEHEAALQRFGEAWTAYMATSVAGAIRDLVDRGAVVINVSAFLSRQVVPRASAWEALEEAFAYAAAKDVVIVIGAGNNGAECADYPGDASAVLVVGATQMDDSVWSMEIPYGERTIRQGSSSGPRLSVMAPAESLVICRPHEARFYESDDGPIGPTKVRFEGAYAVPAVGATSTATPVVGALAALVRSLRPDLSAADVVRVIEEGCVDLGEPGRDDATGWGRVDFLRTLQLAASRPRR